MFGGKKQKPVVTCPVCSSALPHDQRASHWLGHASQIPPGEGEASGQWTWVCTCGPAGMKWPNDFSAGMALEIHMYRAHAIPPTDLLENVSFLSQMERQLGMR